MKKILLGFITLMACIFGTIDVNAQNITVNGNTSKDFNDAIKKANDGDTVVLSSDIVISQDDEFIDVNASKKSIILDLDGHEISSSNNKQATIVVSGDTNVTITGNGIVKHSNNQPALIVKDGDVIIENGTFSVDTAPYYAIHVGDNADKQLDNLTNTLVIKNAKVTNSKSGGIIVLTKHSKLDIENIDLEVHDNTAISTYSTTNDVEINIKDGNLVTSSADGEKQADGIGILGSDITLNITGGTIKALDGIGINSNNGSGNISTINISGGSIIGHVGIYQPQKANLNISGGSIEGSIGIVARQGIVNITGGTIKGTANTDEEEFSVGYKDHKLKPGVAMVVDNQPSTYGEDLVANISGGEFQGTSENAIYSYEQNDTDYVISGGKYNKKFNEKFIEGSNAEIKIGDNYYVGKDAEKAIEEAIEGTTVTVLQGDLNVENVAGGVVVENTGKGNVNVNGETVKTNSQITTNYKIVINFNGEEFILELAKGESAEIGNAKNADGKTLKEAMDELKKNVTSTKNSVYYVDEEGNRVYYTTETDKDMTVTSKYTIKVEVNGKKITPNEGTKVKDIKVLADIAKDDHFYYFEDEEGNHYTLEDELNNNVKLTAIYKVTIKVNPVDGVSMGLGYTTRRGTTLRDILGKSWGTGLQSYLDSEGFLKFVDENGNVIGLDDEITEDTVLTAIYKVVVKFNDEEFVLELAKGESAKIGNAKNADGKTLKEAMDELRKNVPSTKNSVYYVDEAGNRVYYTTKTDKDMTVTSKYTIKVEANGKVVTPNEGTKVKDIEALAEIAKDDHFYYFEDEEGNHYTLDSELNNNIKLTAIYKVTIKVNPVDGVSIGVGYTTRRGTTLRDILGKSWGTGLQAYLDSEGFLNFVDENGNEIGLDDEITEDMVLTAIYEQPENNDVVTPDVTVEEVPTTNPQTLDNIMVYVVMAVGSLLAIVIGILVAKKNKIFNK